MNTKSPAKWIDILRPTKKDLDWLRSKFGLHPVILHELKEPSARARVEVYDDYAYLIYYFPVFDSQELTSRRSEIDFIITRNAVVTVRYEQLEALEGLDRNRAWENSYKLVYEIVEALLIYQERQLRHIREKVEEVGKELFKDKEREVLEKISRLKRDISEYRIITSHEGPILKSLADKAPTFWGAASLPYVNDLMGDHLKIVNQLDSYREAVSDFEDSNNQLMNLKINQVMKTFTTLSFLTFPFMLLAALFGMNTRDTPIIGLPGAFWIVVGVMGAIMITLAIYFKRKGWF